MMLKEQKSMHPMLATKDTMYRILSYQTDPCHKIPHKPLETKGPVKQAPVTRMIKNARPRLVE